MTYQFQLNEMSAVVDAMNGIRYTEGISKQQHLYHHVVDALHDGLAIKWDIDIEAFSAVLGNRTEDEAAELLDRVGAFWDASPHGNLEQGLRDAGLLEAAR